MKPVRTWVLVADGSRARVLENLGPGKGLHQLPGWHQETDLPPSHELGTDRPGRSFDSHGTGRHAMESPSDPHRELKRDFAKEIAARLDADLAKGAYDKLVVVAAPATLGDLRDALSPHVKAVVAGELDRDLTRTPTDEIAGHLASVLRT